MPMSMVMAELTLTVVLLLVKIGPWLMTSSMACLGKSIMAKATALVVQSDMPTGLMMHITQRPKTWCATTKIEIITLEKLLETVDWLPQCLWFLIGAFWQTFILSTLTPTEVVLMTCSAATGMEICIYRLSERSLFHSELFLWLSLIKRLKIFKVINITTIVNNSFFIIFSSSFSQLSL